MSLTGNLEDLPLLDIIQIVSFSKKTGFLTIRADGGEAAIVFREGTVVSSFTWDSPLLDVRAASLPPAKRHALIRNRIEMALEQLIRLREGQFNFSLAEETPRAIGGRDIAGETLELGINAQELLLDLARGIDEDRRDSSAALEASFAEPPEEPLPEDEGGDSELAAFVQDARPAPPLTEEELASGATVPLQPARAHVEPPAPAPQAPAPAAPAPQQVRTLLLVDDEEDVRQILAQRFVQAGYEVVEAHDPDTALKKAGALGKQGVGFVLVTDLGMPTSGGSSFHGGFEVVKRLWKMNLQPPVLMMSENLSGALQARARQMGVASLVFKPGLSKLDPQQHQADLRAFAAKLAHDVLPRVAESRRGAHPSGEPRAAAPAAKPAPAPATAEQLSREFVRLQRHLEELGRTADPTQVSTLVMKVAREFFERGILFLVKNEEVRGLAGFGLAPKEQSLGLVVREVVIPLSEPSLFLDVVGARKPWSGPLPDGPWSQHLIGRIGRFQAGAAALLPLLAHRETIAVLFGDHPETGRDFPCLEALEGFINQAGVALENAFLQRKLRALQQRE